MHFIYSIKFIHCTCNNPNFIHRTVAATTWEGPALYNIEPQLGVQKLRNYNHSRITYKYTRTQRKVNVLRLFIYNSSLSQPNVHFAHKCCCFLSSFPLLNPSTSIAGHPLISCYWSTVHMWEFVDACWNLNPIVLFQFHSFNL